MIAEMIKSKQRVADHGEVFTPAWLVDAMLDLVKSETERIDSRFLEPACGSGNFLVRILQRKLAAVELKFGKSDFEKSITRSWQSCVHTALSSWQTTSPSAERICSM